MHEKSSFVTLTYSEENLPDGRTLLPKDAQDWLKRLRRLTPYSLRYYLVGEYGEHTQRPHYHAAIFGLGPEDGETIRRSWALGHTYTGDLTKDSASYIVSYVTKRMTNSADPRLQGRYPEFARMSLKPGIGALSIPSLEQALTTSLGADEILKLGDVPKEIRYGKKALPLGRYLTQKLRKYLGHDEKTPEESLALYKMQMQVLLEANVDIATLPKNPSFRREAIQKVLVEHSKQRVLNLETRTKIYSKKGQL